MKPDASYNPCRPIRWIALLLLSLMAPGQGLPAQQTTDSIQTTPTLPADSPTRERLVYVIPIQGEFENALYLIVVRALRQAARKGADLVVLDMNTPGGRVDSAIKIRDLLIESKTPTLAHVNPMAISAGAFIALATDKIVMGPNSSIGGALPITVAPTGEANAADEKFQSIFAAEMRKTAKTKNHPVDIAEAFSNPKVVIPGLKKEGEILTLDYDQATSYGLAKYAAEDLGQILEREQLAGATIERFHPTRTDQVARFLSSSAVMGLLMLIGLGGIFIELKSPGVGLPGLVGVTAMMLYFLGSYLANLSSYIEWIFFALGVLLLAIEIYVLPGFGIAGIAGIALLAGSLFFALFNLAPDGGFSLGALRWAMMRGPALTLIAVFLGLIPFLYFLAKLLPETGPMLGLVLAPQKPGGAGSDAQAPATGAAAAPHSALQVGDEGVALSDLHPAGVGLFLHRRIDILTEGEYIPAETRVVVYRVEGSRIFVRPQSKSPA